MADEDYSDDSEPEGNAPKTLREQNKKLAAEKEALQDQLAELAARDRQRTVKEVLLEKKADPRIAKYALRELGDDVSEESVTKWLESDGELFGYKPQSDAGDDSGDESAEQGQLAAEQERISQSSAGAPPAQSGWDANRWRNATHEQLISAGLLQPK